jgi:lipid-A-disaccharide synthase-like uncharacterized protein
MNDVLFVALGVSITPWKLVGYLGAALFAGRWFLQMAYSHYVGRPVLPIAFWLMSIGGSSLLLVYFGMGRPDSVGFLSNVFPALIAIYNLSLEIRNRRYATLQQ